MVIFAPYFIESESVLNKTLVLTALSPVSVSMKLLDTNTASLVVHEMLAHLRTPCKL
jgi:hypothetical protein